MATIDRELLTARIRDIPDFPKPGIVFKDVTPLLADPEAFAHAIEALADPYCDLGVDKVVGIEARGFILAAPVALACGAGFVPARKAGKLPSSRRGVSYELEYGSETVELHDDAFAPGDRVLIVDDVLATGGNRGDRRARGGARRSGRRARLPHRARVPRRRAAHRRAPAHLAPHVLTVRGRQDLPTRTMPSVGSSERPEA